MQDKIEITKVELAQLLEDNRQMKDKLEKLDNLTALSSAYQRLQSVQKNGEHLKQSDEILDKISETVSKL